MRRQKGAEMSDLVRLSRGASPWQPTPTAEIVEIFNEYDQPLLGVFRQDGAYYLFDCLWGHVEMLSVWMYTHLTESELMSLKQCTDARWDSMKLELQRCTAATIALVVDGAGIVELGVASDFPRDFDMVLNDLVEGYLQYVRRLEESKPDADELMANRSRLIAAR
jgi:hypothetical protein